MAFQDLIDKMQSENERDSLKKTNQTNIKRLEGIKGDYAAEVTRTLSDILDKQQSMSVSQLAKSRKEIDNISKFVQENQTLLGDDAKILNKVIADSKAATDHSNSMIKKMSDSLAKNIDEYITDIGAVAAGAFADSPILMLGVKFLGDKWKESRDNKKRLKEEAKQRQLQIDIDSAMKKKEHNEKVKLLMQETKLSKAEIESMLERKKLTDEEKAYKDKLSSIADEYGVDLETATSTSPSPGAQRIPEGGTPTSALESVSGESIDSGELLSVANDILAELKRHTELALNSPVRDGGETGDAFAAIEQQRESTRLMQENTSALERIGDLLEGQADKKPEDEGGGGLLGALGKGLGAMLAGIGGGLKALAGGLAAFANPAVLIGAGVLSAALVIISAGVAASVWIISQSLPTLAEALKSFDEVDGANLANVGKGLLGMGLGLAALFAVGAVDGILSFFGASPIDKALDKVAAIAKRADSGEFDGIVRLSKIGLEEGMSALNGAILSMSGAGFVSGLASIVGGKGLTDIINTIAMVGKYASEGKFDGIARIPDGMEPKIDQLAGAINSLSGSNFLAGLASIFDFLSSGDSPIVKGVKELAEIGTIVGTGVLDGLARIPDGMGDRISALNSAIMVLSGGNFLSGIASLLSFGITEDGGPIINGVRQLASIAEIVGTGVLEGLDRIPDNLEQKVTALTKALAAMANSNFATGLIDLISFGDPTATLDSLGKISEFAGSGKLDGIANLPEGFADNTNALMGAIRTMADMSAGFDIDLFKNNSVEDNLMKLHELSLYAAKGALDGFNMVPEELDKKVVSIAKSMEAVDDMDEDDIASARKRAKMRVRGGQNTTRITSATDTSSGEITANYLGKEMTKKQLQDGIRDGSVKRSIGTKLIKTIEMKEKAALVGGNGELSGGVPVQSQLQPNQQNVSVYETSEKNTELRDQQQTKSQGNIVNAPTSVVNNSRTTNNSVRKNTRIDRDTFNDINRLNAAF